MNKEKWLSAYKTNKNAVWIRCKLTNGEEFNLDDFKDWYSLKEHCEEEEVFFSELILQYRSHSVNIDIEGADGVYLIRAIQGQLGGADKHYYTTGILRGTKVHKKMWIIPELIIDKEFEEYVEECFEEALIHNEEKKNRKEQVQA